MRPKSNDLMRNAMKVAKRICLTVLICIPFLIAIAYLTRNTIGQGWAMILLFVGVMGVAVLVEELVARRLEQKKQAKKILHGDKDVFK